MLLPLQVSPTLAGAINCTSLYKQLQTIIQQLVGDFQANKLFVFPDTINTVGMAVVVHALCDVPSNYCNEVPFLRLMLLSEMVSSATKIG